MFGKKKTVPKKPKKKKKLTCCQRCRRRICKWIWRRCKRCFKKHIFPSPKLQEYEVAGVNLDDVKENLNKPKSKKSVKSIIKPMRGSSIRKTSVVTLYKSNKKKSTKSLPFKEKLLNEFDTLSLMKPKMFKKTDVDNLKENNLYLGLSKDSLLDLNRSEKDRLRKKADEYERKYNYRKYSNADLKILENLSKNELKKKYSITSSKHDVIKSMLSDYKKKKLSLTGLFSKSKVDLNNMDKENVHKVLERYKRQKKRYSYVKQSRIKQFKSDLRAKMLLSQIIEVLSCTCDDNHITPVIKPDKLPYPNEDDVTDAPTVQRKKKRCCPYNFDGKFCREVGNRLLCGYNINVGTPRGSDELINLQNGCIIRGGRLECGYEEPPYLYSRRPPGWDYSGAVDDKNGNNDSENEISKHTDEKRKLSLKRTTPGHVRSTRCLEIRDRIVCRKI